MNPPHIEKAARLMCEADGFVWDDMTNPLKNASGGDNDQQQYLDHATLVWSLARAHTIEEAAKRAENLSDAQHIAHDMRTGAFPKQTKVHDAIAAAIRALAVEG